MPQTPQLAPTVLGLLTALRRRIWQYVWLEGLAATAAALGFAFWLGLGIDWFFEPSPLARQLLLVVAALAGAVVLLRLTVRRLWVRLSDRNMALLIERRFDRFEESLLTAVELSQRDEPLAEHGQAMLAHTCDDAAARAAEVQLRDVFNMAPLWRAAATAGVLLLSIAALAVAAPEVFQFGVKRLATLTNEPWPRNTHLRIEGFDNDERERVVARGTDLEILVQAETAPPLVIPQVVEVHYQTEDGKRLRKNMERVGNAEPGRDDFQDYRYTFPSVLSNLTFDVLGGDTRLRNLNIRVVDSPSIGMTLHCEYPAYMRRSAADLPGAGLVALPIGTRVTIRAEATKDLVAAQVDYLAGKSHAVSQPLKLLGSRRFDFTLECLDADKLLSFTLEDTDGIKNRTPVQLSLAAVADEPPLVQVRLQGIGSAVTPQAKLPLAGDLKDDYGVSQAWIEYVIDEQDPKRQAFAADPSGRNELTVEEYFEIGELALKPGQKLLVGAKSADNRNVPELSAESEPNIASGERFLLDVVTPEQLRAMLESRELNLRQRFESILQEVSDTRDSLAQFETESPEADEKTEKSEPPAKSPAAGPTGAEPEDEPAAADTPERRLSRNRLRIQRARQSGQKNAEETRGVAISFDDIRAELVNNRVDTEELRIRLKDQIADPLKQIAGPRFRELEKRLAVLEKHLSEPAAAGLQQAAVEQIDAILIEMQQVRDKMLEMESFNEAIDLLREIIDAQQNVTEQTKLQRRNRVRSLLEDEE
ncbi:MAG TPA: hypothetical protein VMV10_15070 [Pirellulales bacterium]|nr:hypothetical protein [Pirellulales bacterium]